MKNMSYDLAAKGMEEFDGKTVKVTYGVTGEGKVFRQRSDSYGGANEEIGEIDMKKGMDNARKEFDGYIKNVRRDYPRPMTAEVSEDAAEKTSPRAQRQTRKSAGNPVMPTIGKSIDGEADVDEATVTSDPADPSLRPYTRNEVEEATEERIENESGRLTEIQKQEIEEGELTEEDGEKRQASRNREVPQAKDSATTHGQVNPRTGVMTPNQGIVAEPQDAPFQQPRSGNGNTLGEATEKVSDAIDNNKSGTKVEVK